MPWTRTKSEQLELLEPTAASNPAERVVQPRRSPRTGHALLIPTSTIDEDPSNPRTEWSEHELIELTEDIRQRGILQPIVVHPADASGRYRVHFGAMRLRAAKRAGFVEVPVIVRDAAADPYAQVAENLRRHGLSPLDLARFIRGRIDAGESNTDVARRLGINLTTVAHHLSLLALPQELDEALKAGRCNSPRTLHELRKLHAREPEQVRRLLASDNDITRSAVSALRSEAVDHEPASSSNPLIAQANAACDRLERALGHINPSDASPVAPPDLIALRLRVEAIPRRWLMGSDGQTPPNDHR